MIEGRPRILAVEDDSEAAEQLAEFLSTSGYQQHTFLLCGSTKTTRRLAITAMAIGHLAVCSPQGCPTAPSSLIQGALRG
jgi:hypothetical protein